MQLLPLRRRDALHDLGHGLPLLPDDGPLRELGGDIPLVLHEEHEGLGEVLLRGRRGVFGDIAVSSPSDTWLPIVRYFV